MSRLTVVAVCLCGIAANVWFAWNLFVPGAARTGRNDFLGMYAFGKLAGGPHLYDQASVRAVELRAIGESGLVFPRLPYYALLFKPFSWLPYRSAYVLWEILLIAAVAGFGMLWPHARAADKWILCCWALPAWEGVCNGQDGALLLLWVALAVRLWRGGREAAAGVVLALCASKYNLVLLIPLVVLAQRRWRMAVGAAGAGAAMLAVSFLIAGWTWPIRYWAVLAEPSTQTGVSHMANLQGLMDGIPFGLALEAAAAILIAATVFLAARRTSEFVGPLALALAGGLLVSPHTYLADCALLLPALLIATACAPGSYSRFFGIALATPVPWFLLQLPFPLPTVTRALMIALVFAMAGTLGLRWPGNRAVAGADHAGAGGLDEPAAPTGA